MICFPEKYPFLIWRNEVMAEHQCLLVLCSTCQHPHLPDFLSSYLLGGDVCHPFLLFLAYEKDGLCLQTVLFQQAVLLFLRQNKSDFHLKVTKCKKWLYWNLDLPSQRETQKAVHDVMNLSLSIARMSYGSGDLGYQHRHGKLQLTHHLQTCDRHGIQLAPMTSCHFPEPGCHPCCSDSLVFRGAPLQGPSPCLWMRVCWCHRQLAAGLKLQAP